MNIAYDKYQGKVIKNENTEPIKECHQIIKNIIINLFSINSKLLIDIGSGRGHDYSAWLNANIKQVIGLEPSESSITRAIKKYSVKDEKEKNKIKINYIRAIGNKLWYNGSAGLDDNSKKILVKIFNKYKSVDADVIHMFWTIHYCMDTKEDFLNLFYNIDNNLKKDGKLIILLMNGKLIDKFLKKNNNSYKNFNHNGDLIFQINGYYDKAKTPFGNKIGITLAGTYGLDNEIVENIVSIKFLIDFFKKHNYFVYLKQNFIKFAINNNIDCINNLDIFQKRVSAFYDIIIFNKI